MKLLVTNDDGIDALGLAALAEIAAGHGTVTCVAPHTHLSGCGHRVTTDGPIRLKRKMEHRWAIEGTPADCVRVALAKLAPETMWVLSGMNHGGNLGADVYISGTVAAVREAALHGLPAIAFSHYRKRGVEIDWDRARRWMALMLPDLLADPGPPGSFWNVNFPSLLPDEPEPCVVHCPLESGPLPLSFREADEGLHYDGNYHARPRVSGSDVDVCFAGNIAVTRLTIAT
ncbi:MAG: 5'/3'-nucleotidase SurE [Planctomycetes bacterium]|nr:5'/3'-nucleotidase SurE [Planctomycetota bacterium]